jgi:hypothetical protein
MSDEKREACSGTVGGLARLSHNAWMQKLAFLPLVQDNGSDRSYMDRGRSSTHCTCRPYAPAASAV